MKARNTGQPATQGGGEAPSRGEGRGLPVQARAGGSSRRCTKVLPFVASLCLLTFLAGCQNEKPYEQIGYFKDDMPNRVFQLQAKEGATSNDLIDVLAQLPHTAGQMTIAFIFGNGVGELTDRVTHQRSFVDANAAVLDGQIEWQWWARISPDGEYTFIDCSLGGHTICPETSQ